MRSLAHRLFEHPSILKRNFGFERPEELIDEDPDRRIGRYARWAIELSARAASQAMEEAKVLPEGVSYLIVNTCTGYLCPGISTYLIERLGLPARVKAYDLVGGGCGGALPNLQLASSLVGGTGSTALCVSVEICSATFQLEDDLGLILSNALFGDGAAAAVVQAAPAGFRIEDSSSRYAPALREHIRYVHKRGALHNRLTTRLPALIRKEASAVLLELLSSASLGKGQIRHWALHPGGDKIINEIQEELGLSDTQLRATRKVLSEYGNMSSPTVLFVLKELLGDGMERGEICAMLAFGAGLSAHATLLRKI